MTKFFKETGFLNSNGELLINDFKKSLQELLSTDEINNLSIDELRTLSSNLSKIIKDNVSDLLFKKEWTINNLNSMSYEDFTTFLKTKYGSDYGTIILTKDENDICAKFARQNFKDNLKIKEEENLKRFIK